MGNFVPNALASAHKALKDADNFGQRETGNKKAGDKPSYQAVRQTRAESGAAPAAPKSSGAEPIGGMTGAEGKAALEQHDKNVEALHSMQ